jgi:hypothetical protein
MKHEDQLLDFLKLNDALSLVTEITGIAEMEVGISIGGLSCLMWLCQDKLNQLIEPMRKEAERKDAIILKQFNQDNL